LEAAIGHFKALKLLLEHGEDPHSRTEVGKMPFWAASRNYNPQIERLPVLSERIREGMWIVNGDKSDLV
jgi:hypothetical protein